MNHTFLTFTAALACAILSGCATPYQKAGTDISGGHSFHRVSNDVFVVTFMANGFTSPRQAADFAMLRAAEVALEHRFRYFTILGEFDRSGVDYAHFTSPGYTTGTVTNYGGFATFSATTTPSTTTEIPIFKPGSELAIRCYDQAPGGHTGRVYDASTVAFQLRSKYKLNGSARLQKHES
jgi:hypothetical protein